MSGMAYKLNFGAPLPGFRFKPGECIVDSKSAEEFREGKVTAEQFDAVKMVVLEVGIDKRTEVESYHLLYDSELKVGEDLPWGEIAQWFTKVLWIQILNRALTPRFNF